MKADKDKVTKPYFLNPNFQTNYDINLRQTQIHNFPWITACYAWN